MEGVGQFDKLFQGEPLGAGLRRDCQLRQDRLQLLLNRRLLANRSLQVIPEALPPVGKASPDEAKQFLLVKWFHRQRGCPRLQNHDCGVNIGGWDKDPPGNVKGNLRRHLILNRQG